MMEAAPGFCVLKLNSKFVFLCFCILYQPGNYSLSTDFVKAGAYYYHTVRLLAKCLLVIVLMFWSEHYNLWFQRINGTFMGRAEGCLKSMQPSNQLFTGNWSKFNQTSMFSLYIEVQFKAEEDCPSFRPWEIKTLKYHSSWTSLLVVEAIFFLNFKLFKLFRMCCSACLQNVTTDL